MKRLFFLYLIALAVACSAPARSFAGTIYITNGDAATLQAIDTSTGSILYSATTHTIGYPLAVRNTIWLGERDNAGAAREYNLASGTFTGNSVALPGPDFGNFVDGAVNGNVNYTLNAFGSGGAVYQTNADWTNPQALFNVSGSVLVGITFDNSTGNLWISDQSRIYEYTLGGALLSQFNHTGGFGSLAYEAATDSLWYVPNNPNAPLLNYSTSGTLLQSLATPARSGNVWGAEFQAAAITPVPEPASLALFGAITAAGCVRLCRRKRAIA